VVEPVETTVTSPIAVVEPVETTVTHAAAGFDKLNQRSV